MSVCRDWDTYSLLISLVVHLDENRPFIFI